MAFVTKEKLFSKRWFIAYGLIVLGAFIISAGFVFFITPYNFVPGGVFGIGIAVHHLSLGMISPLFSPDGGFPIGLFGLLFNIPLTLIGLKILGPRFGIKTITSMILISVFMDALTLIAGGSDPTKLLGGTINLVGQELLAAIFGGVLIGVGLGFIYKARATSGGSDIISMIIAKYVCMPLGQLMIYIDSVIVVLGLIVFKDWKIPLYSWMVIFISGKVMDTVLQGINYEKTLFIISDKYDEIRDKIITYLNRGGTYIPGNGMYNNAEKKIIFTVVNRRELAMLEEFIHQIDPDAFLTVMDANEILGKGFKSLKDKISE